MSLKQSQVVFNKGDHSYTYVDDNFNATAYSGVTSILKNVLYPEKYKGVDKDVLKRSAERGTRIHELCQATDTIPTKPQEEDKYYQDEVTNYKTIKKDNGIEMIANEYLVSNSKWKVASQIDCIDKAYNLYDIKTTYTLDKDYVSWQLSFYAELFEEQNPSLTAGKLYAIWLRGEAYQLVEVPRKSRGQIENVLEAWRNGTSLGNSSELSVLAEIEEEIANLKEELKRLENIRADKLVPIEGRMHLSGLKTLNDNRIKITIVPESETKKFDSKKLEKDNPELYERYLISSTRKGYTKITLMQNE